MLSVIRNCKKAKTKRQVKNLVHQPARAQARLQPSVAETLYQGKAANSQVD
jgi:hypothetical protein